MSVSPETARRLGALLQGVFLGSLLLLSLMRLMALLGWSLSFRYAGF